MEGLNALKLSGDGGFVEVPHKFVVAGQVPFSKVLYIESTDFRLEDSKDYYGLAPGKSVLLRSVNFSLA